MRDVVWITYVLWRNPDCNVLEVLNLPVPQIIVADTFTPFTCSDKYNLVPASCIPKISGPKSGDFGFEYIENPIAHMKSAGR
jgi:hypothetical protein